MTKNVPWVNTVTQLEVLCFFFPITSLGSSLCRSSAVERPPGVLIDLTEHKCPLSAPGPRAQVRGSTESRGWRWRKTMQRTSGSLGGSQPPLCHQKLLLFVLNPTWEHSGVCLWPQGAETMALGGPGLVPHDTNHLLLWFFLPFYLQPHCGTMFSHAWLRTFLNHIQRSG